MQNIAIRAADAMAMIFYAFAVFGQTIDRVGGEGRSSVGHQQCG